MSEEKGKLARLRLMVRAHTDLLGEYNLALNEVVPKTKEHYELSAFKTITSNLLDVLKYIDSGKRTEDISETLEKMEIADEY